MQVYYKDWQGNRKRKQKRGFRTKGEAKVRRQLNRQLEVGGILITMVDNRTNYARDISNLIYDTYGS